MNLSCSDCSQSASERCSSTPPGEEPALLTRMSRRPSALWPCATKFLASASLLRSAGGGTIRALVDPACSPPPPPRRSFGRRRVGTPPPPLPQARALALPPAPP